MTFCRTIPYYEDRESIFIAGWIEISVDFVGLILEGRCGSRKSDSLSLSLVKRVCTQAS